MPGTGPGIRLDAGCGDTPLSTIEHVRHLRKEQRDPAEREALRILRLASPRGAQILTTVADQLRDNELVAAFLAEDGGEIGRSVWMRTHSDDAARLFDVAESILNTGDTPARTATDKSHESQE